MTPMTAARSPYSPADRPRLGLRERKKIKTREAIRAATYALVREQGYDATTIEQIAERAEVSPSTVFRYFPTKEDIVLTDEYDPLMLEELRARPEDEPWRDSLRYVVGRALDLSEEEDPEVLRLRARLGAQVPAIRSRYFESMSQTGRLLRQALAERTGRDPESLEVRVSAMALIGGMMEVSMYWAENGFDGELRDLMERALDVMEHGLGPGEL
ncbi:TetR family transcriptional regulator [Streptomyces sp. SID486]|uniref:TetR/AcrR family transcriptional regulator n=1 Tax=unclassified Streptomyces TaxID=2593676 RepID=UPI00136D2C9C|nr:MULTISPECIES: TetR family transcriptional regulator [unclassified Streptomyces]MYW45432.1 TetR family transcriptional regulator [Streptomyces sp. SID161]MYX95682.1 TetR family transcriptional regulator [Streptomyces sp. SID486]